ncbi:MAG: putative methyltransferase [Ilumatobacteraceae bacterium]|nr:putative methyltransferase [Ilumatobacteraceae bacterium]
MPVRCVAFDADDTLWDFTTAMAGGLALAIEAAEATGRVEAGALGAADLIGRFDVLYAAHVAAPRPGRHIGTLRNESFAQALADLGVDDPDLVARMAAVYFEHRHGQLPLFAETIEVLDALGEDLVVGLVTNGNTDAERSGLPGRFDFRLAADDIGRRKPDPRLFLMAAAAAGCRPSELVYVGDHLHNDVAAPQAAGCRGVWVNRAGEPVPPGFEPDAVIADLTELPAAIARFDAEEAEAAGAVGVGPHAEPWPDDERLDPGLLAGGDRRNVVDRFRYWREAAIVAELDRSRLAVHVAVENWQHDLNIGTVVRNANAFNVAGVHIIGKRRWNRRGAMATDRYLTITHHPTVAAFTAWAADAGVAVVGIDNVPGAVPLEAGPLPSPCVLVFGQEGPGLSAEVQAVCREIREITQHGSTRSLNAGVASGIALHQWAQEHVPARRSG